MQKREVNAYLFDAITTHRHKVFRWERELSRQVEKVFKEGVAGLKAYFFREWELLRPIREAPVNRNLAFRFRDQVRKWGMSGAEAVERILREELFRIAQEEAEAQQGIISKVVGKEVEEASSIEKMGIRSAIAAGTFQSIATETIEEAMTDYGLALEAAADEAAAGASAQVVRGMAEAGSMWDVWNKADFAVGRMAISGMRLARIGVNEVANRVADQIHEAVKDEIPEEQFVATLDEVCCLICAGLDGSIWKVDDPEKPIPPMHPSCHCYLVPTRVDWGFFGFTEPLREAWMASNANALKIVQPGLVKVPGRVRSIRVKSRKLWRVPGNWKVRKLPAKVKYDDWFKKQPAKVQKMILGPGRYSLWESGKIKSIKGFTRDGEIVPLSDLAA